MKFLEIFNKIVKGNYALTDESIYYSLQNESEFIPLYGGNMTHSSSSRMVAVNAKNKKGMPITIFSGEGIIISLDGSAGSMTYKNGEKFALNHHAGFISLKKNNTNIVNLEFFALFFQNFYRALGVSDGSKTLSLEQIYSEEINLPSYEMQMRILTRIRSTYDKIESLSKIKEKYNLFFEKEMAFSYKKYQAINVPIKKCIDYVSGNSGLTEEFIYQALQINGEKYSILSSATEDRTMMGQIPMCIINNRPLKIFDHGNGLLVTRNGKAGMTRFISGGKYTINDHAYILFVKEPSPYDIDLKWLSIQYRSDFLMYASSSDNGTWNMTGFFKHTRIDIPEISEQKKVVDLYEKLEYRIKKIEDLEVRINDLFSREIIPT